MRVTYRGPAAEAVIAATDQIVASGETVEVDDDLGRSLCEQTDNWAAADRPAPVTVEDDEE